MRCALIPKEPMNNRIKLKTSAIKSRSEMETLVRDIAGLKLNEQLLTAGMDAEIQGVRDSYKARFGTITEVLAEKMQVAQSWAEANPAEFAHRKSIDFLHGQVGFRTGTPKLKTLVKWKWDGVLQALRGSRWGTAYIRVKEEINKEQIITDIGAQVLSEADLRKAGAQVVQEESFFVETKITRVESREVAQVA
jgi:phage host-nuclease inhibitor protein Gam